MAIRQSFLTLVTALLLGCAPWIVVGGIFDSASDGFRAELPRDWKRPRTAESLVITRDGVGLQWIGIRWIEHEKPFGAGERKFRPSMLPQEAADVLIDALRTSASLTEVELIESGPRLIDSEPGFAFTYRARRGGLKVHGAVRGVVGPKGVHVLSYEAPERHYYDLDLPTFERVVSSFKRQRTSNR